MSDWQRKILHQTQPTTFYRVVPSTRKVGKFLDKLQWLISHIFGFCVDIFSGLVNLGVFVPFCFLSWGRLLIVVAWIISTTIWYLQRKTAMLYFSSSSIGVTKKITLQNVLRWIKWVILKLVKKVWIQNDMKTFSKHSYSSVQHAAHYINKKNLWSLNLSDILAIDQSWSILSQNNKTV